jgi:hypothetical protein
MLPERSPEPPAIGLELAELGGCKARAPCIRNFAAQRDQFRFQLAYLWHRRPSALPSPPVSKLKPVKNPCEVVHSGGLGVQRTRVTGKTSTPAEASGGPQDYIVPVPPKPSLGIRRGVQLVDRSSRPATAKRVLERSLAWRPYRGLASIYLRQAVKLKLRPSDL